MSISKKAEAKIIELGKTSHSRLAKIQQKDAKITRLEARIEELESTINKYRSKNLIARVERQEREILALMHKLAIVRIELSKTGIKIQEPKDLTQEEVITMHGPQLEHLRPEGHTQLPEPMNKQSYEWYVLTPAGFSPTGYPFYIESGWASEDEAIEHIKELGIGEVKNRSLLYIDPWDNSYWEGYNADNR